MLDALAEIGSTCKVEFVFVADDVGLAFHAGLGLPIVGDDAIDALHHALGYGVADLDLGGFLCQLELEIFDLGILLFLDVLESSDLGMQFELLLDNHSELEIQLPELTDLCPDEGLLVFFAEGLPQLGLDDHVAEGLAGFCVEAGFGPFDGAGNIAWQVELEEVRLIAFEEDFRINLGEHDFEHSLPHLVGHGLKKHDLRNDNIFGNVFCVDFVDCMEYHLICSAADFLDKVVTLTAGDIMACASLHENIMVQVVVIQ